MDTLYFLEAEGHKEFDVSSGVGVVGQFVVVVVAVFLIAHAEGLVPFKTPFFPLREPFEFLAGTYEELHFHLLEFAHTEDKLACYDFVAECFADPGDTEGYAHAAGLLYIEVVYENTLCGFRTEVYGHSAVGGRAHLCLEHEVELAYFCPVLGTRNGAYDFLVDDNRRSSLRSLSFIAVEKRS